MKKEHNIHSNDERSKMTCCSSEEETVAVSSRPEVGQKEGRQEGDGHDHSESHSHDGESSWKSYLPALFSLILLLSGMALEHLLEARFFDHWIKAAWYVVAYLPVGWPVMKESWQAIRKGQFFTEFFLMTLATVGAFAIGEYPEGVAVMLFYAVGELFQSAAVKGARNNIKALLDVRPKTAAVLRKGQYETLHPEEVKIGEQLQVKAGEQIPLDGILLSEKAVLNTAALTGESKPESVFKDGKVMAGSINLDGPIYIRAEKLFHDSSIARILELVQSAASRKSKTELLIRRLAKIYTPIVVYLAMAICLLPWFFVADYQFSDWLYRSLIFLVISCPCALVISIPLGYFGGLGAASKNGILFKGATYLDRLTKVNTLVLDKTGTLTKGVFKIKDIVSLSPWSETELMSLLMSLEAKSTHPVARAIMEYPLEGIIPPATDVQEIAGKGMKGKAEGRTLLAGNQKLMEQFKVAVPAATDAIAESLVLFAVDGQMAGYVTIADEIKEDAKAAIRKIRETGISQLIMLSGDKDSITQKVAAELGIEQAKGGLLPEEKLYELEAIKKLPGKVVAFVGDGINDAPVLAASDVGIAMGGLGSDVAIETADVIIQTDQPSKIAQGIRIGKSTQVIIWQNITLAFGIKIIVLLLGAVGLATMWAAVFADVGVALLAILNAVRLQRMEWS